MPARNALPYLDEAVVSVLSQSYRDFEFVILDDASLDGTGERLRYWASADDRIRLISSPERLGPVGSSNAVVTAARGPIVARMDADDVSAVDRLARQIEIFDAHPDVVLVGSLWEGIDRNGRVVRDADLAKLWTSDFAAPFAHGSIMFRRDAFLKVGGYRPECAFWEDLDLSCRMARLGSVGTVSKPLYRHRFSETSTRLTSNESAVERAVDLMFRCRAAYQRGENYEEILAAGAPPVHSERLHPYTFLSTAFITLWSGRRPGILGRLVRRGSLAFDRPTLNALTWAVWAQVSPKLVRGIMQTMLRLRNRKVRRKIGDREVVQWTPFARSYEIDRLSSSLARPSQMVPRA